MADGHARLRQPPVRDHDGINGNVLFDLTVDRQRRKVPAHADRNELLYMMDRRRLDRGGRAAVTSGGSGRGRQDRRGSRAGVIRTRRRRVSASTGQMQTAPYGESARLKPVGPPGALVCAPPDLSVDPSSLGPTCAPAGDPCRPTDSTCCAGTICAVAPGGATVCARLAGYGAPPSK